MIEKWPITETTTDKKMELVPLHHLRFTLLVDIATKILLETIAKSEYLPSDAPEHSVRLANRLLKTAEKEIN